jgi:hypothetical protein
MTMKKWFCFALLSVLSCSVRAVNVYDQPHSGTGTLLASSRYQANGTDYDQYVWDSFMVSNAQAIAEIRWRGGYNPEMAYWGGTVVNFRVSIYASTPGLSQPNLGPLYPGTPATLAAYDTGGRAGETSAGVFGGVPMYDYHFVLPTVFQAAAGTLYWVQIEAELANGIPHWGLAAGTGAGSHFRRIAGQADFYFQVAPSDAAFSLVASDGPTYTIAASAAPADGGTVANAGLYPVGASAPLVAVPAAGYAFVNWTESGTVVSTAPSYTFTVTGDRTLVAHFSAGAVITTGSSPVSGGFTEGGGSYVIGGSVNVQATPSANYVFVNWTESGVPVSTSAAYTFTATADRDLVAHFTPSATDLGIVFSQPPTSSGILMLSSYQAPDGNVDGMEYRFEKFVLTSTSNISQLRWRGGYVGNNQAGNPVVEFVIKFYAATANGFYPDLASPVLKKYVIADQAGETAAGVVEGVQLFDYAVTLPSSFTATAGVYYWIQIEASQYGLPLTWGFASGGAGDNAHYRKVGNSYYGGAGDLAITLSSAVPTSYTIAATSSSVSGGSVSGEGTYALDATVALLALPKPGYALMNWSEEGVIVTNAATYRFAACANRTLVAHFAPTYQLSLSSSSLTMGTVAGAGTFITGASAAAVATAKAGYVFVDWTENGVPVSKLTNYTFSVVSNRTLRASFAVGYTVAASASPAASGTVGGAGGYAAGTNATLVAVAAPGYVFVNWTEGTTPVSALASYAFTVSTSRALTANFALILPSMSLSSFAPGMLMLNWPASLPGWVLQERADLSVGDWTNSSRTVTVVGEQLQVTITPLTEKGFFRLSHP